MSVMKKATSDGKEVNARSTIKEGESQKKITLPRCIPNGGYYGVMTYKHDQYPPLG